jgi:hypothetical protein
VPVYWVKKTQFGGERQIKRIGAQKWFANSVSASPVAGKSHFAAAQDS